MESWILNCLQKQIGHKIWNRCKPTPHVACFAQYHAHHSPQSIFIWEHLPVNAFKHKHFLSGMLVWCLCLHRVVKSWIHTVQRSRGLRTVSREAQNQIPASRTRLIVFGRRWDFRLGKWFCFGGRRCSFGVRWSFRCSRGWRGLLCWISRLFWGSFRRTRSVFISTRPTDETKTYVKALLKQRQTQDNDRHKQVLRNIDSARVRLKVTEWDKLCQS